MAKEQLVFERKFVPETSQCDINGKWRLGSLLEALQNTANDHGSAVQMGRDDLAQRGLTWVLFKMEAEIGRYPAAGEQVTVQTFTKASRFRFIPRYYTMRDARQQVICKAGCLWMIMDKATRKTLLPGDTGIHFPDAPDLEAPISISTVKRTAAGSEKTHTYQPQYTDFDLNAHVNNIRYADWLSNDLGMDVLHGKEIFFISIDYSHEILPGAAVDLSLVNEENEFLFIGRTGGSQAFRMYGRLRKK